MFLSSLKKKSINLANLRKISGNLEIAYNFCFFVLPPQENKKKNTTVC